MTPRDRTPAQIVDLAVLPSLAWWVLPHPMWPQGIGYFGFFHDCPNGHRNFYSFDMDQVRIQGAQRNVVVTCGDPSCELEFDLAPGRHVEVSTRGGRVTVRQIVEAVLELREAAAQDTFAARREAVEALKEGTPQRLNRQPGPIGTWARAHPQMMAVLTGSVATVVGTVLIQWFGLDAPTTHVENVVINNGPSQEELVELLQEAYREGRRDGRGGDAGSGARR